MKCFQIIYKPERGETGFLGVGSGYGENEAEAVKDFLNWHSSENPEIVKVEFYKNV